MDDDSELDAREAAASKELAVRLSLALLFAVLAYVGVARVFDVPAPTAPAPTNTSPVTR